MRRPVEKIQDHAFHYLTPRRAMIENGHRFWICECVCGQYIKRREDTIVKGGTKSCGCQHPRRRKESSHASWRGVGEISKQYYGHLQQMAKIRNHEFNVSLDFLWQLFLIQERRCAYTNQLLEFHGLKSRIKGQRQTASLDRFDSHKGYLEGNVQWIHSDVNRMKNHFTHDRFVEVCKLTTEHLLRQVHFASQNRGSVEQPTHSPVAA